MRNCFKRAYEIIKHVHGSVQGYVGIFNKLYFVEKTWDNTFISVNIYQGSYNGPKQHPAIKFVIRWITRSDENWTGYWYIYDENSNRTKYLGEADEGGQITDKSFKIQDIVNNLNNRLRLLETRND